MRTHRKIAVAGATGWVRQGEVSYLPRARTQLIAARTAAEALEQAIPAPAR